MKLALNGSGHPKAGTEYELWSLPVGSKFRCWYGQDSRPESVAGVLLDVTPGRCIVRVDDTGRSKGKSTTFEDSEGNMITVGTGASSTTSWARETPVEVLGLPPKPKATTTPTRTIQMRLAGLTDPKQKVALAGFNFQLNTYKKLIDDTEADPERVAQVGDKLTEAHAKCLAAGVLPDKPDFEDELLGDLAWDTAAEEAGGGEEEVEVEESPAPSKKKPGPNGGAQIAGGTRSVRAVSSIPKGQLVDGAKERAKKVQEEEVMANTKGKKAAKKATGKAAPAKAAKAPREKKEPELYPCLDGCGQMVKGNFAMGHDAKLKSIILRVEKGELTQANIPKVSAGLIKFKKGPEGLVCTAAPVKFPGKQTTLTTRADA